MSRLDEMLTVNWGWDYTGRAIPWPVAPWWHPEWREAREEDPDRCQYLGCEGLTVSTRARYCSVHVPLTWADTPLTNAELLTLTVLREAGPSCVPGHQLYRLAMGRWGGSDQADRCVARAHIWNIRCKLGHDAIEYVPHHGWRLGRMAPSASQEARGGAKQGEAVGKGREDAVRCTWREP